MAVYHVFGILVQFGIVAVLAKPQVPCYFIFGDSLVDSGNNNELVTKAKANYLPYGIDFPQGATGRFTNGRTMADIIGELLNFNEFIPAYSTATDEQISKGVNYGSGGAGIRRGTGRHLGGRISLDRQLHNHNATVSRLVHQAANSTITNNDEYLRMCLYIVNIGSNDYINNYLRPTLYTTSHKFTPYQYATILIRQYSQQLKRLYKMGARKIVLFGLAPIGCTPTEISRYQHVNDKRCVKSINDAVELFNKKLRLLVDNLNHDEHDAKFTFINVTHIALVQQVMPLPNVPCCKLKVDGQCTHTTVTCLVRKLSIYYDGFHPTEFANTIIARRSYAAASDMDASPYDISHLIQL